MYRPGIPKVFPKRGRSGVDVKRQPFQVAANTVKAAARPQHLLGDRRHVRSPRGGYPRIFTARAATSATVIREARDWIIISTFAHSVSGMVSVGLNAVAFVNETYK